MLLTLFFTKHWLPLKEERNFYAGEIVWHSFMDKFRNQDDVSRLRWFEASVEKNYSTKLSRTWAHNQQGMHRLVALGTGKTNFGNLPKHYPLLIKRGTFCTRKIWGDSLLERIQSDCTIALFLGFSYDNNCYHQFEFRYLKDGPLEKLWGEGGWNTKKFVQNKIVRKNLCTASNAWDLTFQKIAAQQIGAPKKFVQLWNPPFPQIF